MKKLIHEGGLRVPKFLLGHHLRDWASHSFLPAVPQDHRLWRQGTGLLIDREGKSGAGA